jgi:hypothetical protein
MVLVNFGDSRDDLIASDPTAVSLLSANDGRNTPESKDFSNLTGHVSSFSR